MHYIFRSNKYAPRVTFLKVLSVFRVQTYMSSEVGFGDITFRDQLYAYSTAHMQMKIIRGQFFVSDLILPSTYSVI